MNKKMCIKVTPETHKAILALKTKLKKEYKSEFPIDWTIDATIAWATKNIKSD